jgi:hypothetical protein
MISTFSPKMTYVACVFILFSLFVSGFGGQFYQLPLEKLPVKTLELQAKGLLPQSNSYDVQQLNNVWVTQVVIGTNNVLPLILSFYTNETWISSLDKGTVKGFSCAGGKCNLQTEEKAQPMLTYNVTGVRGSISKYQFIYASDFDLTTEATVSGGIGLGMYKKDDVFSYPYTFGDIDPVFSVYLSRNFIQSSNVIFGGYDSQYVIRNAKFQRINVSSTKDWSFSLTRVADQSIAAAKAILDPSLPYIGIPSSSYDSFLNNFTVQYNLQNCNTSGLIPVCDCAGFQTLPTLAIVLGGTTLELPPSAYTSQGRSSCSLLVTKVANKNQTTYNVTDAFAGVWILGEPFMTYYYMVFYAHEGYVNLAPSREISTTLAAWVVMVLLCSFGFIGIVLYRCYQLSPNKQKKNTQDSAKKEKSASNNDSHSIDNKALTEKLLAIDMTNRKSNQSQPL